ncbi:hypothetical protein LV779_09940 [Streptomyces thinghirensis]|nr:hypothetical protein [Streptomyces thinghirensis]
MPTEPTGPAGLIGQEQPKHTHAGNGTGEPRPRRTGPRRRGAPRSGPDGPRPDELALRRMLHHAVQDVEPSDGTLDQLRRAVPRPARLASARPPSAWRPPPSSSARLSRPRARLGATGPGADPSVAGHASQAQGGASQGKGPAGGQSGIAGLRRARDEARTRPVRRRRPTRTRRAAPRRARPRAPTLRCSTAADIPRLYGEAARPGRREQRRPRLHGRGLAIRN